MTSTENKLTFGSPFSGVEGFGLGFEQTGLFRCVWQAEKDPACLDVLSRHFPDTHRFEDVSYVTKEGTEKHGLGTVTAIVGGSPCQGLSQAGKRRGLRDDRSRLFFEFCRLIVEFNPLWFVFENVPGLLASGPVSDRTGVKRRGVDFALVLSGLSGGIIDPPKKGWRNSGFVNGKLYNLCWRVFDSQHFGVPQRRRRVFIVGGLTSASLNPAKVLFESEGVTWYPPSRRRPQERTTRAAAGTDRRNGIDSRTPPQDRENNAPVVWPQDVVGTLAASGAGLNRAAGQENELDFLVIQDQTLYKSGARGEYTESPVAGTITTSMRRFNDNFVYAVKTDNTTSNGIGILEDGTAHTLGGAEDAIAAPGQGVRRLTPIETERLQGFPDDWTRYGASGTEYSDTARYKMMGNAVTVNVAKWIAERLYNEHMRQYVTKEADRANG